MIDFSFINSNAFVGVVGLIAGVVSLIVYYASQRDERKKAAKIILMEIRNAEKVIEELKKSTNPSDNTEEFSVLPTNSWQRLNHFFADELGHDELELINSFYGKCKIIDDQLQRLGDALKIALEEKHKIYQQQMFRLAELKVKKSTEAAALEESLQQAGKDSLIFRPDAPIAKLNKALQNITLISTTTAGAKLKGIGKIQ